MNLPDIDWENETIKTNPQYTLGINNLFIDLIHDLGLTQIVNEPTRGKNTLDVMFQSNPNLVKQTEIIPGVEDHEAVLNTSNLKLKHHKKTKREIRLWAKCNNQQLKDDMANFRDMFLRVRWSLTDVNKMWLFIKHNFMKILNKNVPTKMSSTKHYLPWYNKEIKNLIRRKKLWYERAKKRDNEKNLEELQRY